MVLHYDLFCRGGHLRVWKAKPMQSFLFKLASFLMAIREQLLWLQMMSDCREVDKKMTLLLT